MANHKTQGFSEHPLAQVTDPNAPIVYGIVQPGPNLSEGIAFVQSGDVGGIIDASALQKTSPEIAAQYKRSQLCVDDILFSLRGNIGESSITPTELAGANIARGIARIRVRPDFDATFVRYALQSPEMKRRISRHSNGSTFRELSIDELRKLNIPCPALAEQCKIAEILRTWDTAVEKVNRVIDLREGQYLGLRNYLINWSSDSRVALKTFLKPVSRPVPKPNERYRALSIRSHGKGTFSRIVDKPDDIDMDTLFVAKAGDIIVNITFAWEGAVALVPPEDDGGLVSHRFPTFVPISGRANARYLRHALRMPRFTYLLGTVSPGGAGRNRVLSKSAFLDLEAPLPSSDSQARIATILDDTEGAIAVATKYRDALDQQKRGLMQKLLTGEWRIKLDSEKEVAA
jgi:type I restriction enzyme S subunit